MVGIWDVAVGTWDGVLAALYLTLVTGWGGHSLPLLNFDTKSDF